MRFLPAHPLMHKPHDDPLHRHKRQFLVHLPPDHRWIDDQAGCDVVEGDEDGVGEQEHLRQVHAADGGVVKGALQPLGGIGGREVGIKVGEFAGEGTDAFTSLAFGQRLLDEL